MPENTNTQPVEAMQSYLAAQAERDVLYRSLWLMSADERIAAMRRGELTRGQLAEWTRVRPHEVPRANDEFLWIAALDPDNCIDCPECGGEILPPGDGPLSSHPDARSPLVRDRQAQAEGTVPRCPAGGQTFHALKQQIPAAG